jgi:peptidoglycan hydrolase CwlO-like protein
MELLAGLFFCICIFLKFKLDDLNSSYKYLKKNQDELESNYEDLEDRYHNLSQLYKSSCDLIEKKEIELKELKKMDDDLRDDIWNEQDWLDIGPDDVK